MDVGLAHAGNVYIVHSFNHELGVGVAFRQVTLDAQLVILKEAENGQWAGDLLPVRSAGQKWAKLKYQMLNSGRSHPRLRANNALRRKPINLASEILSNIETANNEYITAVSAMESRGKLAQTWRAESVGQSIAELLASAAQAESTKDALTAAVAVMEQAKKASEYSVAAGRRAAAAKASDVVKPFLSTGVPPVWANKIRQLGLIKASGTDIEVFEDYKTSETPVVGDYSDWDRPAWFQLASAEPGPSRQAISLN